MDSVTAEDTGATRDDVSLRDYIENRWRDQFDYFDTNAQKNKALYLTLKRVGLICGALTPICIFALLLIPDAYRNVASVVPMFLSSLVLGFYQWEEVHSYAAKWEKFRLVAERLKGELHLCQTRSAQYSELDEHGRVQRFVETIEATIRGTDINFFTLMVEPGRRIEKRLESAPPALPDQP